MNHEFELTFNVTVSFVSDEGRSRAHTPATTAWLPELVDVVVVVVEDFISILAKQTTTQQRKGQSSFCSECCCCRERAVFVVCKAERQKRRGMTKTKKPRAQECLTVGRLAVMILCNEDGHDECLATILACVEHFDPEQVHVVDYGLAGTPETLLEEALAELDLHTVQYTYCCRTADQWCALQAACQLLPRRYRHILIVNPKAAARPIHLKHGLQHFATQSTFPVAVRRGRSNSSNNNNNKFTARFIGKQQQQQQQQYRQEQCHATWSATTMVRGPASLLHLTTAGGASYNTYPFQFNLWDRKKLLSYLQEYEDCLDENHKNCRSSSAATIIPFLPKREYAPIAFY